MTRIETRPVTVMPVAPAQAARVKGAKVGPRDPGGPVEARRERGYAGPVVDGSVPGQRGVGGARMGTGAVLTPRAIVPPAAKDLVVAARPAAVTSTRSMPTAMARATVAGASPFAGVARTDGATVTLQPLAPARTLDERAQLPPELVGHLIEVEAAALRGGATEVLTATSNLRKGVLLGAAESPPDVPLDSEALGTLATAVLGGSLEVAERKLAATLPGCIARLPVSVDVNALVQAVLRESYLMQCELLQDFADKVKFYNELKKRIRAELQRARQSLAGASALADDAALGFEYVPAPVDAIEEYGGRASGGSAWSDGTSSDARASTEGAATNGGASGDEGNPHDLMDTGSGVGDNGGDGETKVGGNGEVTNGASKPPDGALVWTNESGQEVLDLLAANKTIAVPYEGNFIVLSGAPPATTAKLGDLVASVSTAVDANGTVLQVTKLPGMGDGKGAVRIDGKGALRVDAGVPLPAGATEWTGQSADEVINTLRDDPKASFAVPYKGKYIVLAGSPPKGTYGSTSLGVTVATTAAGSVIQITGLPDLKAGKGALILDAEGKLERSQSAPLPAGARRWSGESADEVKNALGSGAADAYAIPYAGDFILVKKNTEESPALVATYKGKPLGVSVVSAASGAQLQLGGLPDLSSKACLVLDAEGTLLRSRAARLPDGALIWDGEPSDVILAKLDKKCPVAVPYDGGYVVLSPPLEASFTSDPSLSVKVTVASNKDGKVLQISGLPKMATTDAALTIDARGAARTAQGAIQPEGSVLWTGQGASALNALLAKDKPPVAILYDGKFIVLAVTADGLTARWGDTALTAKLEQRDGQTVLNIRGLPGMNPKTDELRIDEYGSGKLVKNPIESGYGWSASQIDAWLAGHPGKTIEIPYGDHVVELRRDDDGKLVATSNGASVPVAVTDDRVVLTSPPGLRPGQHLVSGKDGTFIETGSLVSRRRGKQADDKHPEYANSHTIKAATLALTSELMAGLTSGQQKALLQYFAQHPLVLSSCWTTTADKANHGEQLYRCPAPTDGQTLEQYVTASAEAARASLPGDQAEDYRIKWLTVEIADWPEVSSDYARQELDKPTAASPVIEDDPALGRGGAVVEDYNSSDSPADVVNTPQREGGDSVDDGGDVATGDDLGSGTSGDGGTSVAPPPAYHEWQPGDPIATKADLDAYVKSLEEKLNTTGDDAQLANVDLQNALQVQQQTIQMMSNISKMIHDTALAIIRKIGG